MGLLKGWFDGSAAKKAPEAAPEAMEPESKRDLPATPELSVVEGGAEAALEAEPTMKESQFWLLQGEQAAKDSVKRFEAANKFFRAQKAEGKTESAKWDKESARYLAWMEATAQVDCSRRLKTECATLETLQAELKALPEMPMLTPAERSKTKLSYSFDDAVQNMKERNRISALIRTQEQFLETLEVQFAEHQLKMEEYDAEVSKEDANIAENKAQEAKRLEVVKAHEDLDAARANLATKTDGFFKKFRDFSIIFRTKEQKEARAQVSAAEKANPDKLMDEYYERFAMGRTNAASKALTRHTERQAQYESDMRRAGGMFF